MSLYCPACHTNRYVVEVNAFGVDRLRSTLNCGHIILKENADARQ